MNDSSNDKTEFDKLRPYTKEELAQHKVWAEQFEQWWDNEGQYHRAGGGDYERTFAWEAWLNREQVKGTEINRLKSLAHNALDSSKRASAIEYDLAKKLRAESQPVMIESERQMNAQLTEENMKLEADFNALKDKLKTQVELLRSAAKSYVYNEREQNIMSSQADDLEKILNSAP